MTAVSKAVILAVGSEMLSPTRQDTNSLYITDVLNQLGIAVAYKSVVADNLAELQAQIHHAVSRHHVLIITGGLGPTDDDLTREAVAGQLGLPLREDAGLVDVIRARFAARGIPMPEVNRRQAQVPEGATVLHNPRGSAPGLLIDWAGAVIAALPGPPREMQPMMNGPVRERLAAFAGGVRLMRRILRVAGRSESRVEELAQPVYSAWLKEAPPIETTILATPGFIELHLSTQVTREAEGAAALAAAVGQLEGRLGADIVSTDGQTVEQVVGDMLRARTWRIALAESCTGGLAASRLTDVAGSSDYVERGYVVYSNRAKTELLGVPDALIAEHGAVSESVARAMADGALAHAAADVAVAITGIAGPGGGTEDKPVGTVWMAVALASPRETRTLRCRFLGSRELIKTFAAVTALDLVRRRLLDADWDLDWARR